MVYLFFFKQKTAYEMRISDWSSECALPILQQDVEQGVAVLAAGQADHDLVAVIDHAEVADRATDLVAQALGQLVLFARGLLAGRGAADGFGQGQDRAHEPPIPPPVRRAGPTMTAAPGRVYARWRGTRQRSRHEPAAGRAQARAPGPGPCDRAPAGRTPARRTYGQPN